MNLWLIAVGMGIVTYGVRLSFLVFVHHSSLPRAARDALNYLTPAILTAFIVPAVLYVDGSGEFDPWLTNERVPAALIAAGVAWATGNAWATIGAGMCVLWVLQGIW
jgi:branched-subunit amino acid transport protein